MSDIFREVDEALQQDKIANIWKEYKNTIIAAVIVLILSTALTTAYYNWDTKRDAQETAQLLNAMEADNPTQAIANIIEDTRKGHAALGQMNRAALLIEAGKTQEAAEIYKQIAGQSGTPKDIRNLARLFYAQHSENADLDILKAVLADEKSPWIWHARLQAATIAAEQNQDYDSALEYLDGFNNSNQMALSLKKRGNALHHIYSLKQNDAKDGE